MLLGKDTIGEVAAFHVEAGRVPICGIVVEHCLAGCPTGEGYIQTGTGDREAGGQEGKVTPRDWPTGRAGPMDEHAEEPIIINMSMDGPEEAGANTRRPGPSIRT